MATASAYQATAETYADAVRALFGPSGTTAAERGGPMAIASEDLVGRAETVLQQSEQLNEAAIARVAEQNVMMQASTPADRMQAVRAYTQASTQLLAKALTDLQVASLLAQTAQDEEIGGVTGRDAFVERGGADRVGIEENLRVLLDEDMLRVVQVERGSDVPQNVPAARQTLIQSVDDAMLRLVEQAATSSELAVAGLLARLYPFDGQKMNGRVRSSHLIRTRKGVTCGTCHWRLYTCCDNSKRSFRNESGTGPKFCLSVPSWHRASVPSRVPCA